MRTFRLDRIADSTLRQGTFNVPVGFDAGRHVVDNLADAPRTHTVSVRVHASAEQVRARIPLGLAFVEETNEPGWVRLHLQAERLDWIPALLAGLDHPFIVEEPAALPDRIRALARQLEQYAGQTDNNAQDTGPEGRGRTATGADRRPDNDPEPGSSRQGPSFCPFTRRYLDQHPANAMTRSTVGYRHVTAAARRCSVSATRTVPGIGPCRTWRGQLSAQPEEGSLCQRLSNVTR